MRIRTLLIANRGEIARRIMRTCRTMGITSVAVFSDVDVDAAHVRDADLSVGLGGAAPAESYLRGDLIIEAAMRTNADAIHPGYGFLSEQADFAQAVLDAGLTFVGPRPDVIRSLGSKIEARRRMNAAGVPLLPSTDVSPTDDPAAVVDAAGVVGYPLLVKASAGGGGRGMRAVGNESDLVESVHAASREAESAFGDGTIYLERFVPTSRHVEVQILGDDSGRVVHLHERECSIQRRHQKVIEEAPSPSLDNETRTALHAAAVRAGEAVGYNNAGTVEFLLTPTGEFFFLEVNTRLQVEHPVTECTLGLDLVEMQLDIAAGRSLPDQSAIGEPVGHAIEARVYAEDPTAGYTPSTGTIRWFAVPGDLRTDSAIDRSGAVSAHYDAMIAKVIASAATREDATQRLAGALRSTEVSGIRTNVPLLVRTLEHPEFVAGDGDTTFLDRHGPEVLGRSLIEGDELIGHLGAAALTDQATNREAAGVLASIGSGFRNVPTSDQIVRYRLGDNEVVVGYRFESNRLVSLDVDGLSVEDFRLWGVSPEEVDLSVEGVRRRYRVRRFDDDLLVSSTSGSIDLTRVPRFVEPESAVDPGSLVATMPGTVRSVEVEVGDRVEHGDVLVVLEAMKMEISVTATMSGTVTAVGVEEREAVEVGTVLVVVDED